MIAPMNTLQTPAHEQLAQSLRTAIRPAQQELAVLALQDTVQDVQRLDRHFNTYAESFIAAPYSKEGIAALATEPAETPTDITETFTWLREVDQRTTTLVDSLVESHCTRKGVRYDPADKRQKYEVLSKLLAGGASKIQQHITLSGDHAEQSLWGREYSIGLPFSLLVLAARLKASEHYEITDGSMAETDAPEILDSAIDEAMQAACIKIQQDAKLGTPKNALAADKTFAAAINAVRTTYRPLKHDKQFHQRAYDAFGYPIANYRLNDDPSVEADEHPTRLAQRYLGNHREIVEYLGKLDVDYKPPLTEMTAFSHMDTMVKRRVTPMGDAFSTFLLNFEVELSAARYAKTLVDGIAKGTLRMSSLMRAMAQTRKQPLRRAPDLAATAMPEDLTDTYIPWEILPQGFIEEIESMTPGEAAARNPYDHERQVDWMRLWRLQEYAKKWQGAYFARTTIEGLSPDKQYYAIILPDTYNGVMVEHAIADHPETGNGMYVWRGEVGVTGNTVERGWQQVFSRSRRIARLLGARRFYHTDGLEQNMLTYLTLPAERAIAQQHSRYTKAT